MAAFVLFSDRFDDCLPEVRDDLAELRAKGFPLRERGLAEMRERTFARFVPLGFVAFRFTIYPPQLLI
jgi:hypothetical protein